METFAIRSGPLRGVGSWTVARLFGREAMNELSLFEAELHVAPAELGGAVSEPSTWERALLAQSVTLGVGDDPVLRSGIVVSASRMFGPPDKVAFRVVISERAWLLTQRRNSRVFQRHYPHEIIGRVLAEHGIRHRFRLLNSYRARDYCTQYEETDWAFVTRLMAEVGVFFFFEHVEGFLGGATPALPTTEDGADERPPMVPQAGMGGPSAVDGRLHDVLVMGDTADGHATVFDRAGNTIEVREPAGLKGGERIFALFEQGNTRPGTLQLRDYDPRRPLLALAVHVADADPGEPPEAPAAPLEVYEHHGEYDTPEVSEQLARLHLEQHRSDGAGWYGDGNCPWLRPGAVAVTSEGNRLITALQHAAFNPSTSATDNERDAILRGCARAIAAAANSGADEQRLQAILRAAAARRDPREHRYWQHIECKTFPGVVRPARPARVMRNVTETATVVGPVGQEIHTDRLGRIKVQFHWDREGRHDGESSCWVRVSQPWAGAGFGHQFIPRVGMEVVVTFLGGDPDRPLVVGSVYNQTHPLPHTPPDQGLRSTVRTQSSPGGGGFNELTFDDQKGIELVYLKAQKNHVTEVGDFQLTTVSGSKEVQVSRDQRTAVGRDRIRGTGGNEVVTVGGDHSDLVGGNETRHVVRHASSHVGGSSVRGVRGLDVGVFGADRVEHVVGDHHEVVGGSHVQQIGGGARPQDAVLHVDGRVFTTAGQGMVLRVEPDRGPDPGIRLVCGSSSIELTPDRIVVHAPHVELRADEQVMAQGKRASLYLDGDARLFGKRVELRAPSQLPSGGPGSSMTLTDADVTIEGARVAMIKPIPAGIPRRDVTKEPRPRDSIHLRLTHLEGKDSRQSFDGVRYRALVQGSDDPADTSNELHEGTIAGEALTVDAARGARSVLLTLFVNEHERLGAIYPDPLAWAIEIRDELPALDQVRGARVALRNLGYEPGARDTDEIDDLTRAAILTFQRLRGIPATGALDTSTVAALRAADTGLT